MENEKLVYLVHTNNELPKATTAMKMLPWRKWNKQTKKRNLTIGPVSKKFKKSQQRVHDKRLLADHYKESENVKKDQKFYGTAYQK